MRDLDYTPAAAAPVNGAETSLSSLAVRGAVWTVAGFGASQILRFIFNLILTRLLFPQLFGLVALVYTILTGVNLFCDIGVGPIVVYEHRGDDPPFLRTVWTLQIIRGWGVALICILLAYPAAISYGDRRLLWILPVLGITSIVGSFNSTSLLSFQRHMMVRPLVLVEVGSQVLSGIVMIVWAWIHPGVWALLSGGISAALVKLVWSYFLTARTSHRLEWEKAALRQVMDFGRWIWISSLLTFLASQIDRLLLGRLLLLETFGVYAIALALSELPRGLALAINSKVIYPAYSKAAHLPRPEFQALVTRHRWPLLVGTATAIAALAGGGDWLVHLLYDKRYGAAGWMLPLLALGLWPSILSRTIDSCLCAIGRPNYLAYANFQKFLFTVIGILVGFHFWGVFGAVLAVALNDLPYYAQVSYGLWRERRSNFTQDFQATLLFAGLLALAWAGRLLLGFGMPAR